MPLTKIERLHRLYQAPGLTFSVRVYIRADITDYFVQAMDPGIQKIVPGQVNSNSLALWHVGDIIQADDEDFLVTAVSGVGGADRIVVRGYADTVERTHAQAPVWIWREFTDRVNAAHAIKAVSSIKRSFEKELNRYSSSAADVFASNGDRFWDDLPWGIGLLHGFTSLRGRWIRFYIHTHYGATETDIRAIGTMLIDDLDTSSGDDLYCRLKLTGLGSLLRAGMESERARSGREVLAYLPTPYMVQRILESVRSLRPGAQDYVSGLPRHWLEHLRGTYGRRIPTPTGAFVISPIGKADEFRKFTEAGYSHLYRHIENTKVVDVSRYQGRIPTAHAWDPQATGQYVVTGDPATVGRHYFGIGGDIVEFDPNTFESKVAHSVGSFASGYKWRIRRLWYNPTDNATAGKPKICGAAWVDHRLDVPSNAFFWRRSDRGALFSWNGGTTFTTFRTVLTLYPGTHCWRDGYAGFYNNFSSRRIDGANGGENITIPFPQRLFGTMPGNATPLEDVLSSVVSFTTYTLGRTKQHPKPATQLTTLDMPNGEQIESPGTDETGAQLWHAFASLGAGGATPAEINMRWTMGQQGACAFTTAGTARAFVMFCELNDGTGLISVKVWEVAADVVTTIHTFASPTEQPISCAGYGIAGTLQNPAFCMGRMEWNEAGACVSKIDRYDFTILPDTWTRTQIYTAATDAGGFTKSTPLWMQRINGNGTAGLVVSWFQRDWLGRSDAYGINRHNPTGTISTCNPVFRASSLIHAITVDPTDSNKVYAADTAGRIVRILTTTGPGISTVTPLDRSYPPIDGEHWSACDRLVPHHSTDQLLFGISSPVWPFGDDTRGGRSEGLYILWTHDNKLTDIYELGDFGDKTAEDALADIAFASHSVWGFDVDGRGNFFWGPRFPVGAAVVTIGAEGDRNVKIRKSAGYGEIENVAEITPFIPRIGDIKAQIELLPTSPRKSAEPFEAQSNDLRKKVVVLKCARSGRIGVAAFDWYSQGAVYKTWLARAVLSGVPQNTLVLASQGRAISGPNDDTVIPDRMAALQMPSGARIRLPDGSERGVGINGASAFGDFLLFLTLDATWTPTTTFYPGAPVDIDLEFARKMTDSTLTTSAADGKDLYLSGFDWKEVGAGQPWATGLLLRFFEPNDDGNDINYLERAWNAGERIVVDCPGLETVANDAAKIIISDDANAIAKYGEHPMRGRQAVVSPRRALFVAETRVFNNKRPRWVYTGFLGLCPYFQLGQIVRLYAPQVIRQAPLGPSLKFLDEGPIRMVQLDPSADGSGVIEILGSKHD